MEPEKESEQINDKFCKLFVGQKLFVVSEDTLLKHEDSYFAKLLSERFEEHKNKHDIIYIDRDGRHFHAILNYLRGCLNLVDWSIKDLRELATEADYYLLTELKTLVESQIEIREEIAIDFQLCKPYCSVIYDSHQTLEPILKANGRLTFVVSMLRKAEGMLPRMLIQNLSKTCGKLLGKKYDLVFVFRIGRYSQDDELSMFDPQTGKFDLIMYIGDNATTVFNEISSRVLLYEMKED